jgi:hypothetical protein
MLNTYNLRGTAYFPTRIANNSATLVDSIFIDNRRSYTIKPCINGLSDHDAQLITFNNITVPNNTFGSIFVRNINKNNIAEFQLLLSWEQWENIFGNNNVNNMFKNFLNTYLRCFYASFPKKKIEHNNINNRWITKGIVTSCIRKRDLLLLC